MAKNVTSLLTAAVGYLKGKVEDGETVVGENLYNDIIQFFVKLLDDASIAASDDFDNETNGYQFIDALESKVLEITGGLRTKIVPIGFWDMSSTAKVTVDHGLADVTKIRGDIGVIILSNTGDPLPLGSVELTGTGVVNGGVSGLTATTVALTRTTGALFDDTAYSTLLYERGYITINYLP